MAFGVSSYYARPCISWTIKKTVLQGTVSLNTVTFDAPIPDDYELYVNRLWFNKGHLEEVKADSFTLSVPSFPFGSVDSVYLKYYTFEKMRCVGGQPATTLGDFDASDFDASDFDTRSN